LDPNRLNLVIFKVNQLGDNIVFLPVLQSLQKLFPAWDFTILTSPVAVPLYSRCSSPGEVWPLPTRQFNRLWKSPLQLGHYLWRLKQRRLTASILADDQGNIAHLLARLAGGDLRVGVRRPFVRVPGSLTHAVEADAFLSFAELNWKLGKVLLDALGMDGWPALPPAPDLSHLCTPVPESALKPIVLHPGASSPCKMWPPERARELAQRLAQDHPMVWIDQPGIAPPAATPNLTIQRTETLNQLVSQIAAAGLFIGNNSGPMHLASALGIPSVILNGVSYPHWDPFWNRDRIKILRSNYLPSLTPETLHRPSVEHLTPTEKEASRNQWTVDQVHEEARKWYSHWKK
jgi:ADP-heptose:LPS heptosyltransferase